MEQVPLFTVNGGEPKLCTIPDFARAHDIPVQTLYSAVQSGRVIYVRMGGRLYLNHESAEKYLALYRKYTLEEN